MDGILYHFYLKQDIQNKYAILRKILNTIIKKNNQVWTKINLKIEVEDNMKFLNEIMCER